MCARTNLLMKREKDGTAVSERSSWLVSVAIGGDRGGVGRMESSQKMEDSRASSLDRDVTCIRYIPCMNERTNARMYITSHPITYLDDLGVTAPGPRQQLPQERELGLGLYGQERQHAALRAREVRVEQGRPAACRWFRRRNKKGRMSRILCVLRDHPALPTLSPPPHTPLPSSFTSGAAPRSSNSTTQASCPVTAATCSG
jgi:hypothetical protein